MATKTELIEGFIRRAEALDRMQEGATLKDIEQYKIKATIYRHAAELASDIEAVPVPRVAIFGAPAKGIEPTVGALLRLLTHRYPADLRPCLTLSYINEPGKAYYASLARFVPNPASPKGWHNRDVVFKCYGESPRDVVRQCAQWLLKEDRNTLEARLVAALTALT